MAAPEASAAHGGLPGSTHPAAQTPMMRQFFAAKAEHPDAILLFRMGDFYETFFDDAVEAAQLLELTLTSRNKNDDEPIPMAGVPHHSAPGYIRRLLEAGRKVAICEQVEDPRQAKGIVKREVVQVVTPGVVLDEDALDARSNNYLAAIWRASDAPEAVVGAAWADVSTGELRGGAFSTLGDALDELARLEPRELLVPGDDEDLAGRARALLGEIALTRRSADGGPGEPLEAAEALLRGYIEDTQKDRQLPLQALEPIAEGATMRLGPTTVRNLELVRTLIDGKRRGSVLGLMDRTATAMGGRLLKQWLLSPLLDPAAIRRRHDAVEALTTDLITRAKVRDALAGVYDLERLVTRTVAQTAGPRDVVALASSLEALPELAETLRETGHEALLEVAAGLDPVPEAVALVRDALVDDPPMTLKDGGVIREGFHDELDELLSIARDGKRWFADYAQRLRDETGIGSLKVRFNNVFGYFIEVTKANLHHVPDTWLRKQTLANSERYYTPELKEREEKVLGADERRGALESELFEDVRRRLSGLGPRIQRTARAVATLDVLAGLAELAARRGYVRPEVDDGCTLRIEGGRHPVIEAILPQGEFVPNDLDLDAETSQLIVITGPNMAGKSTVMRQAALIAVMAQMGSFVPADSAHVGVIDRVFTRVGASDNLAQGQSTFMVEMTEAAEILTCATRRSLVVIDEIGRGTSTYDGVSIAWAIAEHLHDAIGARTLFATHYHELTELAATRPRCRNMSIAVKEWQDEIVFLRRLVPGGTNRSYGIQVGRLAGLPQAVVERAREILHNLEADELTPDSRPRIARGDKRQAAWQLNLFAPDDLGPTVIEQRLQELDPDALTPRAALDLVYELRDLLRRSK